MRCNVNRVGAMMPLLVFLANTILYCFAVVSADPTYQLPPRAPYVAPYPETQDHLAEHQDAWKTVVSMRDMYLYQRSYEGGDMFGKDGACIRAHRLDAENGTETETVEYRYLPDKNKHMEQGLVGYYKVYNTTAGNNGRTLYRQSSPDGNITALPVAFSNYKTCVILRVPEAQTGGKENACQMWVSKEQLEHVDECCSFIFGLLCGPGQHVIYNKTKCDAEDRVSVLVEE
ncbi:male-specific histamine-binding salivary protein-like [Ornithodoros turicata]|uniref:male-specific histamine-binding salivary protein-like n=1 Tax=Ornithodoros turicata TaxID=34597 RepID=UPI003139D1D6